jgi:hypothetical protein
VIKPPHIFSTMGKHASLGLIARYGLATALCIVAPTLARAQAPACDAFAGRLGDLDILDDQGDFVWGNTVHLEGPPGAGTTTLGTFIIINRDSASANQAAFPYSNCNYNNIYVALRTNLVNQANPALAIPAQDIILNNLPHVLPTGQFAFVGVSVILPPGTVAGRYLGSITISDSVAAISQTTTGEIVGSDQIDIEVVVDPLPSVTLVNADSARRLDSLVVRGRAGERATGTLRVANTGNAPLTNVQVSATDLQSESSVGIVIPAQNISISTTNFSSLAVSDTQRVTVAVSIPPGVLGGRYRGSLLVQGQGATPQRIPLVVIVTSSRGIVFENNPVRNANGVARIAFNGDPGTDYQVGIFDMNGLLLFTATGTVFPGLTPTGTPGTAQNPGAGADFAVNVTWPLVNGRGEGVASGTYLVVVESTVNGQRQLARDKLMVIR